VRGPVVIEPATLVDLPRLVEIERHSSPHPWTPDHFRAELGPGSTGVVLVVHEADPQGTSVVLGFCVYRVAADEMHVDNMAIDPGQRRRGLARQLLQAALRRASSLGARTAWLEVRESNQAARRLYEGEGFRRAGRRRDYYQEPDEDALLLRRSIEASDDPG
jgi:ribosomal-protein-alanine N-acetyltransferase